MRHSRARRTGAWLGAGVTAAGVAAALLSPAAAQAAPHAAKKPVNLILNAGAETAKPDSDGDKVPVKYWVPNKGSEFTAVTYGTTGFPGKKSPGPKDRGSNFFAGGTDGDTSGAHQAASLKADASLIKSGKAAFTLSGWLGGYSSQEDYATFTVTWEGAAGKALGHTTIGPVTAKQRKNVTGLLRRAKSGVVPKGSATALLTLHMVRKAGEYVDGYADDLSLTVARKS